MLAAANLPTIGNGGLIPLVFSSIDWNPMQKILIGQYEVNLRENGRFQSDKHLLDLVLFQFLFDFSKSFF